MFGEPHLVVPRNASKVIAHKGEVKLKWDVKLAIVSVFKRQFQERRIGGSKKPGARQCSKRYMKTDGQIWCSDQLIVNVFVAFYERGIVLLRCWAEKNIVFIVGHISWYESDSGRLVHEPKETCKKRTFECVGSFRDTISRLINNSHQVNLTFTSVLCFSTLSVILCDLNYPHGIGLSFSLWLRCSPPGFHQSPLLSSFHSPCGICPCPSLWSSPSVDGFRPGFACFCLNGRPLSGGGVIRGDRDGPKWPAPTANRTVCPGWQRGKWWEINEGNKWDGKRGLMDGQEVRGWREVRIREVEQYLYHETCLYQDSWRNFWGWPRENFSKSL